jgi:hypothetical protein
VPVAVACAAYGSKSVAEASLSLGGSSRTFAPCGRLARVAGPHRAGASRRTWGIDAARVQISLEPYVRPQLDELADSFGRLDLGATARAAR